MGLFFYKWSKTAASNATADANVGWSEGQAPSTVNDSARSMMASTAAFRDDIAGAIVTGGTSTAYTVTSNQIFDTLANMSGAMIAFTPHATNGGTTTLNVDSLGAKPLRSAPSVELPAGTLIQGTPYTALYNNSDAVWYLHNFYGANPYNVPLAGGMDFWGTTVPNSSFAFPTGQAISRSTYADLFSIMGTTHGAGDGSTTFNLPDKTGRISAMKESTSTRLTSTYFGGNSQNMGSVGGGESKTLSTTNLPAYTPSGSVSSSVSSTATNLNSAVNGGGGAFGTHTASAGTSNMTVALGMTISSSFSGNAQGGNSTPFAVVQPTIICNYIIRVL